MRSKCKINSQYRAGSEKRCLQFVTEENHPFMIKLHSCFQSPSRLYFAMDFAQGGDLFTLLDKRGTISEKLTRFYACEILLALSFFHSNNIIYR